MNNRRRVLITGGGTGGHVFPMLAVADALRKIDPGGEVIFVGTDRGIENELVPKAGYELKTVRASGMKAKSLPERLFAISLLPWAVYRSAFILKKFGPHVVLGGGGYAAGPVCIAAALLRLPLALLEVNSLPGLVNRKLAGRAEEAYVAFSSTAKRMKCRSFVTGNPIRSGVRGEPLQPEAGKLRILVLGGSQGAVGLNTLVIEALPHIQRSGKNVCITHQTGKLDFERVKSVYADAALEAQVTPFIEDMAAAYKNNDFVISRAGATTVAELIAARRPSLLVPLPTAADNHQELNAAEIVDAGGGVLLKQEETTGMELAEKIGCWYDCTDELIRMSKALARLDHPDAARNIAERLIRLAQ